MANKDYGKVVAKGTFHRQKVFVVSLTKKGLGTKIYKLEKRFGGIWDDKIGTRTRSSKLKKSLSNKTITFFKE